MIIIGLTGSIAMGKTTAANILRTLDGVAVHCSDEAVRELYNDARVIDLIKTTFPNSYDKKTNGIDKQKLIEEIGFDHEKWNALEDIFHPFVRDAQQGFIKDQTQAGTKIVVLDIPLLFETGAEARVDYVICVSAPGFIQNQRALGTRKMSAEDFGFRLSRQMPDAEKCQRADFIVQTGQGLACTRRELQKIIDSFKEKNIA